MSARGLRENARMQGYENSEESQCSFCNLGKIWELRYLSVATWF